MYVYGELTGTLSKGLTLQGTLNAPKTIEGQLTIPNAILPPSYEGPYEVTPSSEEQTLETDALYMTGDIKINPIPNNYGLITYDGSTITVS